MRSGQDILDAGRAISSSADMISRRARNVETASATKPSVYTSLTRRKNAKTQLRATRQTRCLEETSLARIAAHRHSRREN